MNAVNVVIVGGGIAGLEYRVLRERAFAGRHFNFMRGSLEAVLLNRLPNAVDIRYGQTVDAISQDGESVFLTLSDGSTMTCDLLVGADGIHSKVRSLVWGEERLVNLRHVTAAFLIDSIPSALDREEFSTMTSPGRMVAVYPTGNGDGATTFFVHQATHPGDQLDRGPEEVLTNVYGDLGWVVPGLLQQANWDDVYFDGVAQVQLDRWVKGRVALVGDSAWCVSLLAGQGASLGMAGGLRMAAQLTGPRGIDDGLEQWESGFRPIVEALQHSGQTTAKWFVPESPREWRSEIWPCAPRPGR